MASYQASASASAARVSPFSGPWSSVLITVAVGLTLTFLVARLEQMDGERERELRFGREAEAVQQTLSARVEDLSNQFETARAFIGATHPSSAEVYGDYFGRNPQSPATIDPGVLFVEEVARRDIGRLEARERGLANPEFEVIDLGAPTRRSALVITRASAGGSAAFPLLGYDISLARDMIIPAQLPADGFVLRVAESASLLATTASADLANSAEVPSVSPFFVGEVIDIDGERVGWAIRFLDTQQVTSGLDVPPHINVQLSVRDIGGPIAIVPPSPESPVAGAELYERRVVGTAGQAWTMEVWADPSFGGPSGIAQQRTVLAVGLAATVAMAIAVCGWQYYRHRLAGASFELEHARTLATTDQLTGLLNRSGLIDGARRFPALEKATLYFVDLDGFKTINDERGHAAGDAVLSSVGQVLRANFRHDDLVARIGGDEFIVFTVGDRSDNNVRMIGERVVERIGDIDPQVSCSLGIAHRPPGDGSDIKDLLREADEAMYRAKRDGGDHFVIAAS